MFDFKYFRKPEFTPDYPCWVHHVAMKWFRDVCERSGATAITFENNRPYHMPCVVCTKGPSYHWDPNAFLCWRWQGMLAQLVDDSLTACVTGIARKGETRSRGIISCSVVCTQVYDLPRWQALKDEPNRRGPNLPMVWDFLLQTDTGAKVGLHPSWSIYCQSI